MMEQTNVDYLFQMTAAFAERGTANSSVADSAGSGFGDHFAKASESALGDSWNNPESARRASERPAERAPFEPDNGGSYEAESAELGGCAESAGPSCCDDTGRDSGHHDPTQAEAPAVSGNSPTSGGESNGEKESHQADEESDQDAGEELGSELVAANAAAETLSIAIDAADAVAVDPNGESSAQSEAAGAGSKGDQSIAAQAETRAAGTTASEITANNGESAVELAQSGVEFPSGEAAGNLTTDETGQAENTKRNESPANTADVARQSALSDGSATAGDAVPSTGESANTADKTSASRRTSGRSKGSDDSGRRSNEGNESPSVQRTGPAGATEHVVGAAIVTAATADARSLQAANSGDEASAASTKQVGPKGDIFPHAFGRSQRGHGAAGRGARTGDATPLPRVDVARFVGRVAKAIQTASERGGALQLRLSPPELGSLRLQLSVEGGVMAATLEADSSAARQVLLDHLPALRDRLAEQNIRIERFDVDVRQDGSGGQADARASHHDHRGQQPHQANHRRQLGQMRGSEDAPRNAATSLPRITNDGINLLA
jgi:flagellar hook-length control protein FliK